MEYWWWSVGVVVVGAVVVERKEEDLQKITGVNESSARAHAASAVRHYRRKRQTSIARPSFIKGGFRPFPRNRAGGSLFSPPLPRSEGFERPRTAPGQSSAARFVHDGDILTFGKRNYSASPALKTAGLKPAAAALLFSKSFLVQS